MALDIHQRFENALLDMDRNAAFLLVEEFMTTTDISVFIEAVLVNALKSIGEKWEEDQVSLSQIYMSGKICEEIVDKYIVVSPTSPTSSKRIAIVTLEDYHALGKRIVSSMLKSSGFEIIDYGQGVDVASLIEKVKKDKVDILLISVLMYPSALKIKEVSDGLTNNQLNTRLLVGGAPFIFDKALWKQVGAHGIGVNPSEAISILEKWVEGEY